MREEIYRLDVAFGMVGEDELARKLKALNVLMGNTEKEKEKLKKPATITIRDRASQALKNVSKGMNAINRMAHSTTAMLGMGGAALGAGALVASSVKKAMDFESQMSTIQALTGSSGAEMKLMSSLALEMGAKTKYSALEAGQGIEELLKAGLSPATVKAGGLEAALNLATAGGLGLADAAETMSTALNAFRKDGMKASDAADALAGAANTSATDVDVLRQSLAMVSAVASVVGMSFKDTTAALGVMADYGLKGSDAGTSLKTMLNNLQPKTKSGADMMRRFGLLTGASGNAFYDASGKLKKLEDIAGLLHDRLKKLNPMQRQNALEVMFGSDAIRAAAVFYEAGAKGVKAFTKEMGKVTAIDVAAKKMDNASGAVEQFRGAIETLQISALLPLMPSIKRLALGAADFATAYGPDIERAMKRAGDAVQRFIDGYASDEVFKNLDLADKVGKVLGDAAAEIAPIAGRAGALIGGKFAKGLGRGVMEAISQDHSARLAVSLWAGVVGGPWSAAAVYAAGTGGAVGRRAAEVRNAQMQKEEEVSNWLERYKARKDMEKAHKQMLGIKALGRPYAPNYPLSVFGLKDPLEEIRKARAVSVQGYRPSMPAVSPVTVKPVVNNNVTTPMKMTFNLTQLDQKTIDKITKQVAANLINGLNRANQNRMQ